MGDCDGDGVPDTCQLAADPTLDLDVNGVLDACEALGTPYCSPATANSTGSPGELTVVGEEAIALNSVTLTARHLPVHAIGVFVTSLTQAPGAGIPNSQGTLCLGGDLGRFVGPGQIQSSGFHGALALNIDLNAHPTSSSFVSVLPGETWNYQLWHRDAVGAGHLQPHGRGGGDVPVAASGAGGRGPGRVRRRRISPPAAGRTSGPRLSDRETAAGTHRPAAPWVAPAPGR